MKIEITESQRKDLISILELLDSPSLENNILAFSLLKNDYSFLNYYTLPARTLYIFFISREVSFLELITHGWNYSTKIFIEKILCNYNKFNHRI